MPDGIPAPEQGELVLEANLELGETHDVGTTPFGQRRLLDVTGGSFTGQRASGSFLTGGLELELTLDNGTQELEQINILRTQDGASIFMRNCGIAVDGGSPARIVVDFEAATSSSYAWLNTGTYVATRALDETAGAVTLQIYDVSDVAAVAPTLQFSDPPGVPNQPWDCSTMTGTKGATVFTENVTLGTSISVGASKRGTRNIIPITGGTVSGRFSGSVVPGGADYQLLGGSTKLDARYSLVSGTGDYVLVRNCGPFGALIPQFEAATDGTLDFLNANTFLSSDPGTGGGGVSITFYERQ